VWLEYVVRLSGFPQEVFTLARSALDTSEGKLTESEKKKLREVLMTQAGLGRSSYEVHVSSKEVGHHLSAETLRRDIKVRLEELKKMRTERGALEESTDD